MTPRAKRVIENSKRLYPTNLMARIDYLQARIDYLQRRAFPDNVNSRRDIAEYIRQLRGV
jgi:hypothetical protein